MTNLSGVARIYDDLRQAGDWLVDISNLLDTEGKAVRIGAEVREELFSYEE